MSKRYLGGVITANPATPTGPFQTGTAPGMWTTSQQLQYAAGGVWPIAGLTPNYIENMFSTYLYTGNGSTQTINNGIDLAGKGGLVWTKSRSGAQQHTWADTARGIDNVIYSSLTNAQTNFPTSITAISSTGYSLGSYSGNNNDASNYASWTFREQPKFFDVVTYTGNGAARTIAHNLGSVPGCIIVKCTSGADNWFVQHRSLGSTKYIALNDADIAYTNSQLWNNTDPTSTVFTLGTNSGVNANGQTYVAYLFAHDAGGFGLSGNENVISCGSYTGSAGTTTVNVGFEPQWLLVKRVNGTFNWIIVDNMRGFFAGPESAGAYSNRLFPNTSDAESVNSSSLYTTPTGFTVGPYGSEGGSGGTYIYIAIRRGPMAVPTLGTTVYAPITYTGDGAASRQITGAAFPPDLSITKSRSAFNGAVWYDKLRGNYRRLQSNDTAVEATDTSTVSSFNMNGISIGNTGQTTFEMNYSGTTYVDWMFRRAPGFMDEVCWTANGSAQNIAHNLGVAPELMIFKGRSVANNWYVGANFTSTTYMGLYLDGTNAGTTGAYDNAINAQPTAAVFRPGSNLVTSGNTVVTYLFASCPGVSKVGSYTGTGATININCGFTTGARFVLIKNTSSAGSWYVWDSARGMVSGTDPSLALNTTGKDADGDSIFAASTGFQVVASPFVNVNSNGSSYIFLAVS